MEEHNAPLANPNSETLANGQAAPVQAAQAASDAPVKRTVYVDEAGIQTIMALEAQRKNKAINVQMAPAFYRDMVLYLIKVSPANRGTDEGRPTLKEGTPAELFRQLLAKQMDYTGEQLLVSPSTSKAIVDAINNNRVLTSMFFRLARQNIADGSKSEEQAKESAFEMVTLAHTQMVGDLTIPVEALEALWEETAEDTVPVA